MNYAFINVEWDVNQKQMVALGVTTTNEIFIEENKFFEIGQPKQEFEFKDSLLKRLGTTREQLDTYEPIETVFKKFINNMGDYEIIVCWNKKSYEFLIDFAHKEGYIFNEHKVVFVQGMIYKLAHNKKNRLLGFASAYEKIGLKAEKTDIAKAYNVTTYLCKMYKTISKAIRILGTTEKTLYIDTTYILKETVLEDIETLLIERKILN